MQCICGEWEEAGHRLHLRRCGTEWPFRYLSRRRVSCLNRRNASLGWAVFRGKEELLVCLLQAGPWCSPGWPQTPHIADTDLILTLLPLLPKFRDYKSMLPHLGFIGCWGLNPGRHTANYDNFFNVYEYFTIGLPGAPEGQQKALYSLELELQAIRSYCVGVETQTWVFCKSRKCS